MQETLKKTPADFGDEINFQELVNVINSEKKTIILLTSFITVIGLCVSLLLPNIYESKALLVPVSSSNSIAGSLSKYSGLAGLTGISLPSEGDESNSTKAVHKIRALSFFENSIMPNIFLPDLMAIKSWDYRNNTMIYDDGIYNQKSNTWVRDFSYPYKQIPSAQESFIVFIEDHINISEDSKTGFITLSIKHQSPYIAQEWVELLVDEVNFFYREKDKSESEKAIGYLNEQISMTALSEIKLVIAELLQEETQKLTLIEANEFYVFDYIDPPAIMEEKSGPKRALICILSTLLGIFISLCTVLFRHFMLKEKLS